MIEMNGNILRLVVPMLLLLGVGALAGQVMFWVTERPSLPEGAFDRSESGAH